MNVHEGLYLQRMRRHIHRLCLASVHRCDLEHTIVEWRSCTLWGNAEVSWLLPDLSGRVESCICLVLILTKIFLEKCVLADRETANQARALYSLASFSSWIATGSASSLTMSLAFCGNGVGRGLHCSMPHFLSSLSMQRCMWADTTPEVGSRSYLTDTYRLTGPLAFIGNLTLQCTSNSVDSVAQFVRLSSM